MRIDINQKKIALGDQYRIYTNEKETHQAHTELFTFLPVIQLAIKDNLNPLLKIHKKWSLFKAKYDMTIANTEKLEFRTKSFWRPHYQCQLGADLYDVYANKGRKYSVYKNNVQIAWWDKEAVTWFEGDNYTLLADDDADHTLLIAFCLIVDNFNSKKNEGNTVTYDFGNIGRSAKPFDEYWRPKVNN